MAWIVERLDDPAAKAAACAEIIVELPMWFGRTAANAKYIQGMATRDAFATVIDGRTCGLVAVEYHFGVTCNIWWFGVSPAHHRRGAGRALVERAANEAKVRGCKKLTVETMSPRSGSREYELTRHFYQSVAFVPFIEFEPEPGDWMMWMHRQI